MELEERIGMEDMLDFGDSFRHRHRVGFYLFYGIFVRTDIIIIIIALIYHFNHPSFLLLLTFLHSFFLCFFIPSETLFFEDFNLCHFFYFFIFFFSANQKDRERHQRDQRD